MKTKILLPLMLLLIGCTDTNIKQNIALDETRPSCLVEERNTGEIVMCFEGKIGYVKRKCKKGNQKKKKHPIVTLSESEGCPRDRGYVGYCVMDGGEYIPYNYIDPTLNISQKDKEMMKKMYQEDCLRFGGDYHVHQKP